MSCGDSDTTYNPTTTRGDETMPKYSINADEFNAVMACAAVNDVRYYLNAFCIDADACRMVATNGHVMGECDLTLEEGGDQTGAQKHVGSAFHGYLYKAFTKPLPKSAERVEIDTDTLRATIYGAKYKGPGVIALEIVDGRFPDYTRVSTRNLKPQDKGEGVLEIGLAPVYLFRPVQWAHLNGDTLTQVHIVFGADNIAAMRFSIKGIDAIFTLMPSRS